MPGNGAGAILRTARERQRRDIAAIAQELCIPQRYVVAMENDDLTSLPGGFYYQSFARQYAAAVGVDEMVIQPRIDFLLATLKPLALPGKDTNQRPPVRGVDPILREINRSLAPSHIGPSLLVLIATVAATSGLNAWYEHLRERVPVSRITPALPQQVRPNFPAAAATPELTPAVVDLMIRGLPTNREAAIAPAAFQPGLITPIVNSAPREPALSLAPPRKAALEATDVLQEPVLREQVVRRVLPEIAAEDRARIRGKATVVVSVIANQSGAVTEAIVEESDSPSFRRAATEAAGKWRFAPLKTASSRQYFLRFEITGTDVEATVQQPAELRGPKDHPSR